MKHIPACIFAAVFCLIGVRESQSAQTPPKWNILFVFADDWGRYASCYKGLDGRPTINDVIHTPNIDQVAKEGVLFKNAFVNAPSCTPCRSSLLSGRYFFNTGRAAILQGAIWDAAIPSYPLLIRDAGYQIGKSYKVWSPGSPVRRAAIRLRKSRPGTQQLFRGNDQPYQQRHEPGAGQGGNPWPDFQEL